VAFHIQVLWTFPFHFPSSLERRPISTRNMDFQCANSFVQTKFPSFVLLRMRFPKPAPVACPFFPEFFITPVAGVVLSKRFWGCDLQVCRVLPFFHTFRSLVGNGTNLVHPSWDCFFLAARWRILFFPEHPTVDTNGRVLLPVPANFGASTLLGSLAFLLNPFHGFLDPPSVFFGHFLFTHGPPVVGPFSVARLVNLGSLFFLSRSGRGSVATPVINAKGAFLYCGSVPS